MRASSPARESTLAIASTVGLNEGVQAEVDRFTEITGIEVELVPNLGFDITRLIATGGLTSAPDVVGFFSRRRRRGRKVVRSTCPPTSTSRPSAPTSATTSSMQRRPMQASSRALRDETSNRASVLIPKRRFDAAGYTVPSTWDELVELSSQMVADGHEPWCFNWEAGFASGFAGGDFLDELILRVPGTEVFDGWAAGEITFDDPRIVEAAQLGEELLFGPGFVAGGTDSIRSSPWQFATLRMLDENPLPDDIGPPCWLSHGSSQPATSLVAEAPRW